MRRVDPRVAGRGLFVAGDFNGTVSTQMGDHDLGAVLADPHRHAGQTGRHRVDRPLPLDRRLVDPDGAGQAERGGVGVLG